MALKPKRNYYELLQITPDASFDDIKRAYRSLAIEWHPDNNPGDHTASERMSYINEAYKILSNKEEREKYDYSLRDGLKYDESALHMPSGSSSALWPMFGGSPSRTRRSPSPAFKQPVKKWTANLGDKVRSSPAISADGSIYVGTDGGKVLRCGFTARRNGKSKSAA